MPLNVGLYLIATLLQLAALAFAVWMVFHAAARRPWVLLVAAMSCMLAYRVVALGTSGMRAGATPAEVSWNSFTASFSVLTSLLLLLCMFSLRRMSLAQQRAESGRNETIEALRESEQRCRNGEERLLVALDTAGLGQWQLDLATETIQCSPRCKVNLGLAPEATLDFDQLRQMIHPEDRERVTASMELALREHRVHSAEYRVLRPDGTFGWILASGRGEYGTRGEPLRMTGVILDVTARKQEESRRAALLESERAARSSAERARAAAERASLIKDEFLANLSHELRTPLTAIQGWCDILRVHRGEEDVTQGLDVIRRNTAVQIKIIEDLLDMSRIISGKIRLEVQPVELATVIGAAIATVRPAADAKNIQLISELDPAPTTIAADPNRLQQVFWNLLSNAIKFTPKSGRVEVTLRRVESHLEVTISDSGEGIKPEFLPFVFDRFRQADGSTTRKHGGLGLGLAIVKSLVELHGGTVSAHSRGEGLGAQFTVALPIRAIQPWQLPEAIELQSDVALGGNQTSAPLAGVRVLVVDDEEDVRRLVKRLLEEHQAEVLLAPGVEEGLEQIARSRPDVLISDIAMPENDGFEFIGRVRALPAEAGGTIPAIALTAHARSEDRRRILQAGFQLHAVKPVLASDLVSMVLQLSGRTRPVAGSAGR